MALSITLPVNANRRRSSQKVPFSARQVMTSPRNGSPRPTPAFPRLRSITSTLPPTLADLTSHELQKARAAFDAQEAHGPVRSMQQLRELLLQIGETPTEAELAGLTRKVRFEERQVLDWPRFHTILRLSKSVFLQMQSDREAETKEAFTILSHQEEEGGLPTDHLQTLLEGYGLRLDVKDVARRELRSIQDESVLTFEQFSALFGSEALIRAQQEADRAALQRALPNNNFKLRAIQKVKEMTFRKTLPQMKEEAHIVSQRDSAMSDEGEVWDYDLGQVHNQSEELRRQLDTCVPSFRQELPRRRKKEALPHLQTYLERPVGDRLYPYHERPAIRLSNLTKQLAEMEEATGVKAKAARRSRSPSTSSRHYMQDCQCLRHSLRSSQPEPFSGRSSLFTLDSTLLPYLLPPEDRPISGSRRDDPPGELPVALASNPASRRNGPRPLDESLSASFPRAPERSASTSRRADARSSTPRGRPPWDPRPLNLDVITAQARHGGRTSPPKPMAIPSHMRPATQEYARELCLAALLTTDRVDEAAAELEELRAAHAIGLRAYEDALARSQCAVP
eukprot:GGOE01021950.1.p2 GENE.GGOE01021950.1~~GGOE01021950.1.p2  ORF type:complete len:566 (-),score=174.47 GGOE01021950.1:405-2102(-)